MARFLITFIGDGIYVDRGAQAPYSGFVAMRCIRLSDEEQAVQRGKIELLKDWRAQFNRENKAGTPQLEVHSVRRLRNPLKRLKLERDYQFYGSIDERDDAVAAAERAVKRWFIVR